MNGLFMETFLNFILDCKWLIKKLHNFIIVEDINLLNKSAQANTFFHLKTSQIV
jgi:hypothetical protein